MRKLIEEKLSGIEIPNELHKRCVMGINIAKQEMEENTMKKNTRIKSMISKTVAAAAVLAVCIFTVSNTTAANSVKGFFRDVTGWGGAVVGTEYVQATDEVGISVLETTLKEGNRILPIEIAFLNEDVSAPFRFIEEVTLGNLKIVDEAGENIDAVTGTDIESAIGIVNSGKVLINLPVSAEKLVADKEYTLILESFYGCSKADAPIEIKGNWECKFEVKSGRAVKMHTFFT